MASSSNLPSQLGRPNEESQAGSRRGRSRLRSASRGPRVARFAGQKWSEQKAPPTRSWVNVARLSAKGYELSFVPPTSVGKRGVVHLSEEVVHAADPKWNHCLMGYFIGKNMPFKMTELVLKETWGSHLTEMLADDEGFYFFFIPDPDYCRKILEEGRLTVNRVPLILKQWDPTLELRKDLQSSVPVWIRMKNIPFAYWSALGISHIASAVGRPLYVDPLTEKMKRLSFARVCVEVSAKLEKCESVEVFLNGESFIVPILYEWIPIACLKCHVFGHNCEEKEVPAPVADKSHDAVAEEARDAAVPTVPPSIPLA
ncbi:hypothetical protein ACJRO7_015993 [Eucalyptus globulus]|uniref:DUF4283 domain-containing protein n=1 Tax=Eucalyptus globulus TaxID=34317 RepID=A0ABD3L9A1_EUCGL